jgi:hypothetical protein
VPSVSPTEIEREILTQGILSRAGKPKWHSWLNETPVHINMMEDLVPRALSILGKIGKIKAAKKKAEQILKRVREASETLHKELRKPGKERDQNLIHSLTAELGMLSKEANAIREDMEALARPPAVDGMEQAVEGLEALVDLLTNILTIL